MRQKNSCLHLPGCSGTGAARRRIRNRRIEKVPDWPAVDALTRLAQKHQSAGDRTEADPRASRFLSLVS